MNKAKRKALMFLLWQFKTGMIHHLSSIKLSQIKNNDITQGKQACEETGVLIHWGKKANQHHLLEHN